MREKESLECRRMPIWALKTQKLPGAFSGPWTPAPKGLASLARLRFATSATFGLGSWGPPWPNPGSVPVQCLPLSASGEGTALVWRGVSLWSRGCASGLGCASGIGGMLLIQGVCLWLEGVLLFLGVPLVLLLVYTPAYGVNQPPLVYILCPVSCVWPLPLVYTPSLWCTPLPLLYTPNQHTTAPTHHTPH